MKICACIAEYNPFHLGHLKHIEYMRYTLGAEKIIVVMSGNFTQRGEPAVLDKFTRARHAVLAGADLVIELPTVFATANAETFATGAINLINSLGVVDGLCFGVEGGSKFEYLTLAKAMLNESREYKKALKDSLENGVSLAKAKFEALKVISDGNYNENLITFPNNILGLEYTKALLKCKSEIEIYPMLRTGDHNDKTLKKGITSATSIREVLKTGKIKSLKKNLPPYVYSSLNGYPVGFDNIIMSAIVKSSTEFMATIPDCTEGLENRIKALAKDNLTVNDLLNKVCTKRYTATRINRILINNLLGISSELVKNALTYNTYAKVLAVNQNSKDLISLISSNSQVPVLTRKSDLGSLKKTAEKCWQTDVLANDLYAVATKIKINENNMLII